MRADYNECALGTSGCSAFAICTDNVIPGNGPTSFTCTCKDGYSGNGFNCTGGMRAAAAAAAHA